MPQKIKTLIAVLGPTASGKTALSIELAQRYNTIILSADSRQFYREMNIGTAKPNAEELASVPHYFINNLAVQDQYTAGIYERDALKVLSEVFKVHDVVILAGGSTLYIRALLGGIDEMPTVSLEAREEVRLLFTEKGLDGIRDRIQILDPDYFANSDISNHRRLMRALEVCISSGKPYSSYLNHSSKERDFNVIKIGIDIPREELYSRINNRCDAMLSAGLLEEVKSHYEYRNLTPLHTVGYSEFFDFLDGKTTYEEAVTLFKQHTRNYAKRQMTWFRKEEGINWVSNREIENKDYFSLLPEANK